MAGNSIHFPFQNVISATSYRDSGLLKAKVLSVSFRDGVSAAAIFKAEIFLWAAATPAQLH